MSEIVEWLRNLRKKQSEELGTVPPALSELQEIKIASKFDERERWLDKRLKARKSHGLVYVRRVKDGDAETKVIKEPSLRDQIWRRFMSETVGVGAMGEKVGVTPDNLNALSELGDLLEGLQMQFGAENPFVQTVARLYESACDHIAPRTFKRKDIDVERIVVPTGMVSPFSGINVEVLQQAKKQVEAEKQRRREERAP